MHACACNNLLYLRFATMFQNGAYAPCEVGTHCVDAPCEVGTDCMDCGVQVILVAI